LPPTVPLTHEVFSHGFGGTPVVSCAFRQVHPLLGVFRFSCPVFFFDSFTHVSESTPGLPFGAQGRVLSSPPGVFKLLSSLASFWVPSRASSASRRTGAPPLWICFSCDFYHLLFCWDLTFPAKSSPSDNVQPPFFLRPSFLFLHHVLCCFLV